MARNAKNTRMCLGCMARKQKTELVALFNTPQGVKIGSDTSHGRGAYLCKSNQCMEKAIKKKSFSRALRCEISPAFYDEIRAYFTSFEE